MIKVLIIESECGWGQKIDEIREFDTMEKAESFVKEYNNKYNPPGPTPDWYMFAKIDGDKEIGMMR